MADMARIAAISKMSSEHTSHVQKLAWSNGPNGRTRRRPRPKTTTNV